MEGLHILSIGLLKRRDKRVIQFKKGLIILFSFLLVLSFPVSSKDIKTNSNKTIYVDDDGGADYLKIQDAIDNANNNDTIFVYSGTYYENLVVNKTLTLIGEDKNKTIIDGKKENNTVELAKEKIQISNFTIINSSIDKWYNAGIRISSSNCIINDNIIKENMLGVFGKRVENITIFNNKFYNDSITFSLYDSENQITQFSEKYFIHNIYNNSVNSRKIYYYKNQEDKTITEDAGQVIIVNCKNITVKNANLSNADYSCVLVNSSKCLIKNSTISNCDGMIWLTKSNNNKIIENQINNNFEGICIDCQSKRNLVKNNNITNNRFCGIIVEDRSNFNRIIENNFIGNNKKTPLRQAYFKFCFMNIWHKNYWNEKRILPKLIIGNIRTKIPWFNFDLRPSFKEIEI